MQALHQSRKPVLIPVSASDSSLFMQVKSVLFDKSNFFIASMSQFFQKDYGIYSTFIIFFQSSTTLCFYYFSTVGPWCACSKLSKIRVIEYKEAVLEEAEENVSLYWRGSFSESEGGISQALNRRTLACPHPFWAQKPYPAMQNITLSWTDRACSMYFNFLDII